MLYKSHDEKEKPKSSWQHRNFSVMFTTENEIIRSSWRQIFRLRAYDQLKVLLGAK